MSHPPQSLLADRCLGIGAIAGAQGGPRTYGAGLLHALARLPAEFGRVFVLSDQPGYFLGGNAPPWMLGKALHIPHPVLRPLVEERAIPRIAARLHLVLYHGTKNYLPAKLPCPGVVTIHDLAPFRMPETFPMLSGRFLRWSIRNACARAERIIAVSQATAMDLCEILDVPAERIDVIYNGVSETLRHPAAPDETSSLRQQLDLHGPVVLCLGTVQPRKNQLAVLHAFLMVRDRLPRGTTLLFVGRRGWKTAAFARDFQRYKGEHIRWIESFPDADLRALYGLTSVLIAPSEYEGFGLTLAEAMTQGVPVIALARSAVPEVVGSAGALLEAADPELLGEALQSLMLDRERRVELSERGRQQAAMFTWRGSAARHLQCYAQALGIRTRRVRPRTARPVAQKSV